MQHNKFPSVFPFLFSFSFPFLLSSSSSSVLCYSLFSPSPQSQQLHKSKPTTATIITAVPSEGDWSEPKHDLNYPLPKLLSGSSKSGSNSSLSSLNLIWGVHAFVLASLVCLITCFKIVSLCKPGGNHVGLASHVITMCFLWTIISVSVHSFIWHYFKHWIQLWLFKFILRRLKKLLLKQLKRW